MPLTFHTLAAPLLCCFSAAWMLFCMRDYPRKTIPCAAA
jgi:hypothetical protein